MEESDGNVQFSSEFFKKERREMKRLVSKKEAEEGFQEFRVIRLSLIWTDTTSKIPKFQRD